MLIPIIKKTSLGVIIITVIWFLFGYSPEPTLLDDGKIHINYWRLTGQKDQTSYVVDEFNKSHDRIVVHPIDIPWQEHEKKVLTAVLSGDPPDVMMQLSPLSQWASRMALVPLSDFIKKDNFDTTVFFPALWGEMKWQGLIFGLPARTASYGFFCNTNLLIEAGLDIKNLPKTWDEVRAYSKKLTKYNEDKQIIQMGYIPEYGFTPGHGDLPTAIVQAWQLGAKILIDNGTRVSLTNPASVEALEWVTNFHKDYDMDQVSAFIAGFGYAEQHAFLSDKVAMMMLPNTYTDYINDYRPNMEYTVSSIPTFPGKLSASASGSWWLGIPKGAKHPREAWEFMKYMVDKNTQLAEAKNQSESLFPASRLAAYSPEFMTDSTTKIFVEQMEVAHSPAIVPLVHGVFWREYLGAREQAVKGALSPRKALEVAEKQIQLELDKAVAYDEYVRSKMAFESREVN
jgi:ABC-type glycerol-3-phosphate transport system substrate-binding protein